MLRITAQKELPNQWNVHFRILHKGACEALKIGPDRMTKMWLAHNRAKLMWCPLISSPMSPNDWNQKTCITTSQPQVQHTCLHKIENSSHHMENVCCEDTGYGCLSRTVGNCWCLCLRRNVVYAYVIDVRTTEFPRFFEGIWISKRTALYGGRPRWSQMVVILDRNSESNVLISNVWPQHVQCVVWSRYLSLTVANKWRTQLMNKLEKVGHIEVELSSTRVWKL